MTERPTHAEILGACKTLLETLDTSGVVVIDPLYSDDPVTYAPLVMDPATGVVDGWVLEMGSQEPRERAEAGATVGFSEILFHGFVQVNPGRAGESSLAYSGRKWREAEALFELKANEELGFARQVFRQYYLHSPFGFPREQLDQLQVHYAPYVMRFWTKGC
jgi:hypothetical protein